MKLENGQENDNVERGFPFPIDIITAIQVA